LNGRSGPFLWMAILTTTIMVNRRIVAKIIRIGMLLGRYIVLICGRYLEKVGKLMRVLKIIIAIHSIVDIIIVIINPIAKV